MSHHVGLIDLRSTEHFIKQHIAGSCSLPWLRLPDSMHELPANHHPVSLLGDAKQIQQAKAFLISKGYKITDSFLADDVFWQNAVKMQQSEEGCTSVPLWQANPLLIEIIEQLEQQISGRTAIDLACGAGRDSVYLSQRGWQVTSIDNKTETLSRCKQLAESCKVDITTSLRDLEQIDSPLEDLSSDLVIVMRYLHRPLFQHIDKIIKPGGAIIYSTFMVGSEQFGSPKNPNYLLKSGELATIFSSYRIIIDQQRTLADGRPVALFAAIKPSH